MRATSRTMVTVILAILFLCLFSPQSFAQSDNANPAAFSVGKPARILDLPDSAFRNKLLSLSPQARGNALKWMQGFNFPAADVKYLRVNDFGEIYYADTFLPPEAGPSDLGEPVIGEAIAESEIFLLHSRPGSSNVLYLDFDGHVITGTRWNSGNPSSTGIDPHPALPFDPSGNDLPDPTVANFTSDELNRIGQIWHRMAEDYAPFDIDITTEEPDVFTNTTGRVLFTHDIDANGNDMPAVDAGGVAWINVFGSSSYVTLYSPALVYYTNLYTNQHGDATLNAEAGSHEFGHNIAMGHDGPGYYAGHGTGLIRWGPIMGGSYQDHVSQWSKGEYDGADNTEDDLAIIAGDLGYAPDDHGDSSAASTELVVEANGDVLVSSPELDPHNALTTNKGIINNRDDTDWFYIDVGEGPLDLIATPSWHSFESLPYRGSNLDIEMTLYDSLLTQVDIGNPADDTIAAVSLDPAAAGRYYVKIDGVGSVNYSDYNSMGMYFIEGTVTPPVTDETTPSPSPMSFSSNPTATGAYSITMTATTATDDSGYVEYQFACQMGGVGCITSSWQITTIYTATGLDPNTTYSYVVRARDSSQNTTLDSDPESATTNQVPPADPSNLSGTTISATEINLTWTDNSTDETGFKLERQPDGQVTWDIVAASLAPNTQAYADSGLSPSTLYHYRVSAFNAVGSSGFSSADAATFDPPLDGTPIALTATMVSSSSIDVTWTDVATNAASFVVQHSSTSSSGPWTTAGSVGPGVEYFQDTGLISGTEYWYRVYASNNGNESPPSNVVSATTDYECSADVQIPENKWIFFSLPCTPSGASSTQASEIFLVGPAAGGDYGSRWIIARYDSSLPVPDWDYLAADENLAEGKGYILYSVDAFTPATIAGSFNTGGAIPLDWEPDYGEWNLVGNPKIGTINWTDITVFDGSSTHTWAEMDVDPPPPKKGYWCDDEPADADCVMWRQMYKRVGYNTYDPFDGTGATPAEQGTLDTAEAMWVRSHNAESMMVYLPEEAASISMNTALSTKVAKDKPVKDSKDAEKSSKKAGEWRVRLLASSGSLVDSGNWLGQQRGVEDGLDARDLEEWTPFSSPYLSILFTNPLFDEVDWGYTRDFRKLTKQQQGEWPFVVRASSGISEVTLRWEGEAALFNNASLTDEISGETIAIEPGGGYTFEMNGTEHPFRIIFN